MKFQKTATNQRSIYVYSFIDEKGMRPEDIMKMDWLVDNVIGDIPSIDELIEGAKPVVELKGVEESREE